MHILHVLFTRYRGGLEQAYVNDTEALKARGHSITALVRLDAPYRDELSAHAASIITVNPNGFYDIFAIAKIRMQLRKTRPDCIIAHNGRAIALLAYAAWGLGIPLCGVSHSYKTARAFHADRLVVLSPHMRDHFLNAGFTKPITIIPNLMHLPPEPVFKQPSRPFVIGAMGRFSEEKGFADLFHALGELKKTGLDFRVHLGGDGPEQDNLKALETSLGLKGLIEWKGWVQDKAGFYKAIDVLCLPSREDSFPMVLLETLAHGVPVVSTDAPGPISVLTSGTNGILVPRQNAAALAEALHRVATQPALAERLALAGRVKAQDFGFDSVATQWDQMLRSFISLPTARTAA